MGKPTGFMEYDRELPKRRPVEERIRDWREIYLELPVVKLKEQGARCMDCGIPFCHKGCPLGNLIPDWNDLIYRDRWEDAIEALHATNNFPEFTGRICPAPCEEACVLGINARPVTIKNIEVCIVEEAFKQGFPVRVTMQSRQEYIGVTSNGGWFCFASDTEEVSKELRIGTESRGTVVIRNPMVGAAQQVELTQPTEE